MSRPLVRVLATVAACTLATAAPAEVLRATAEPAAAVYSSVQPGGETTFALTLRADALPELSSDGRDHVVLVDTSASQVGAHRRQALAVLDEFLSALPAADRVLLYAVDLKAHELTGEFVAADSEALANAVEALHRRFPAGATQLPAALEAALARIDGSRPASILYIGDGMSMAHVVQAPELKQLLAELVSRRVPVHSYAVGPQTDPQLLGTLAAHTGGVVRFDQGDEQRDAPAVAGRELAAAVSAPVFYPDRLALEPGELKLQPEAPLPMRTDRATVYLGRGALDADVEATVSGRFGDEPLSLTWRVAADDFRAGRTYLTALYEKAERTGGVSVGFAGAPLLQMAQEQFNAAVEQNLAQGERALAARNPKLAEAIALDVKKADPANVQADALLRAALRRDRRLSVQTVAQAQPDDAPALPGAAANQPADALPEPRLLDPLPVGPPPAGADLTGRDLIRDERIRRQVVSEQVEREVAFTIDDARRLTVTDPQGALIEVKRTQERVQTMTDLIPEVHRQLVRRLDEATIEIRNQLEVQEQAARLAAERRSQIEAEARLIAESRQREEDLEMLLDRVRGLMQEGRHGVPDAFARAEAVARHAVEVAPDSGAATAALFGAVAAGELDRAARVRALRADKFLQTLYQVELSHVPFPDEPPVVWPPAEDWQALTQRRRKWASVSLETTSPSEERIRLALIDPQGVDIEFIDQPLKEAMEYLADAHGITILLDEKALQDEGIQTDEPLNHVLSGITLRSALKIMLEPLGLTYVIEDEVMKITTIIAAEEKLSTRVYPVGDLVIPIITPMMGGLGQGLGGGGGFGGGGGQFGGGGGGFGGGGFGGGGGGFGGGGLGGGGGGFFSIPPEKKPSKAMPSRKPQAPASRPTTTRPVADPEVEQILNGILGEKTSRVDGPFGAGLAQVRDPQPFRLDNAAVDSLKKKPRTAR